MEQKKTKLVAVITWNVNALIWCVLFGLALYFHQRLWIIMLYSANALLGIFTAGMHIHQYIMEHRA